MEAEYIRIDKKSLSISQLKSFFNDGTFVDKENDLFTKEELALAVNTFSKTFEFPSFGAIENELGEVVFKTGKLQQFVDAILKEADDEKYPAYIRRKLRTTHLSFYITNEWYNKEWSHNDLVKSLTFFL